MADYIDLLEEKLCDEDKSFLLQIYEPRVVALPPSDAFCSLCVTDTGEIRCYGTLPRGLTPDCIKDPVYISSSDCGLSWKMHRVSPETTGASVKSPYSGRWLSPFTDGRTLYMRISDKGCGSGDFKTVTVGEGCVPFRLPLAMRSMSRWIVAADFEGHGAVFISDDDGESWRRSDIPKTDRFSLAPPHMGPRWENSGVEPAVLELRDGSLVAVLRTSTDFHYITKSRDGGESWSHPVPTSFHSTLTNPHLLRLRDGRILFFYNNSRPLPETDHKTFWPPLSDDEINGVWEDVFTNRDTNCVAVSEDDGKSWKGFRELYLNELRNTCDFRSSGSNACGRDKSVHQFQSLELPHGKVMVHVGQHMNVRKILIFDVGWLYEKNRSEDFRCGMGAVSSQVYLKSVSGGYRGFTGHCAWNRTNGAVLVPDPSGDHTEALLIKNTNDDRLFSNAQGAVWNFPAAFAGSASIRLCVMGKGIRISLSDHWINPVDITVGKYAQFSFVLTGDMYGCPKAGNTAESVYTDITVDFDTRTGRACLSAGGRTVAECEMNGNAPNGICYLHLQTVCESGDEKGALVKKLSFSAV